ncbi:hypothetical protein MQB45_004701 [Salmonella enterica subsp. enterica serovar Manhattan]|nr:hypothetical protein [Salmonella enterica subsp. enterica serovar Anatum]EFV0271102.1 hypothetical protein [Salmonella enterica]EJA6504152.1 hypothetical protein [Salmonella enterica subsp. enterica serovar Manhattan]EGS6805420.1 hypothetical protein [Salmonella enterica]EHF0425213.1 hypothetical protein [Salmonella enterica]
MAVLTLPAAAHVHLTATSFPGRRGQTAACQVDVLSFQRDFSALAGLAVSQQMA